jgi:hypothetical protein
MAAKARQKNVTKRTAQRVTDCKSYVEVGQPKVKEFDNSDKNINLINTKYTHCVAEHYALT